MNYQRTLRKFLSLKNQLEKLLKKMKIKLKNENQVCIEIF